MSVSAHYKLHFLSKLKSNSIYVHISVRLSPKVFLKRPASDKDWRLDKILQEKAVWVPSVLKRIFIVSILCFYSIVAF